MMITEKTHISFTTDQDQKVWSAWENKFLEIKYCGDCEGCGRRTYLITNSNNDPRGPLGDHTNDNLEAREYEAEGPDVIACFPCRNDRVKYDKLLVIAATRWD